MGQPNKVKSGQRKLLANEVKWGVELVEAGWTMLPSTILTHQQALGLDPVDLNILLQIARHWWKPETPPVSVHSGHRQMHWKEHKHRSTSNNEDEGG